MQRYQRVAPENAEGSVALARVRRLADRFTEALLAAQQAVTRDPYDPRAYRELALAYIALNRPGEAIQQLDQASRSGVTPDRDVFLLAHSLVADRSSVPA